MALSDRWDFLLRYHLANGLMRLSLAVLPACRVRDELRALLAAYRAGCEAVVLLDAMKRLDFFIGEAGPEDRVDLVGKESAVVRVVTPRGADGLTAAQREAKIGAALKAASRQTGVFGR